MRASDASRPSGAWTDPRRWSLARLGTLLVVLAILIGSYRLTEIDPALFFAAESQQNILAFVRGMFPPELSPRFLGLMVRPTVETIQISVMGTFLAMLLGFPLALLAANTLTFAGVLREMPGGGGVRRARSLLPYLAARWTLNVFRSVPDLVWALMFVRAVGLGPFPGVLAIGVSYGGMLGKIYAEILENVDPGPMESLQAAGASKLQILLYALLPQAFPGFVSYSLYRWECAIRSAAILGLVGAGGLGQQIELSMRMFNYHETWTIILLVFLLVTAVDGLSAWIRKLVA
ncbi:MAG: phosphonate ABC transporter, permease protein PhnE [Deltaproteobacteria bacterium]|nr:phosphonate ABC transporter, permease protein PhnE [Deltaproteobacteria bacterium]